MNKKQLKLGLLSSAIIAVLAGCGGSDDDNYAPEFGSADVNIAKAQQWMPIEGQVSATDPNGDSLSYSAEVMTPEDAATPGTVTIDNSGRFVYTPITDDAAQIKITVSDGQLSATQTVTIEAVDGDPLTFQQWHLRNTGQTGFAMADSVYQAYIELRVAQFMDREGREPSEAERAKIVADYTKDTSILVEGEDLNVMEAYAQGATGQGSISVVVDSGLAIAHEDLQNNVLPGRSINFIAGSDRTDPTSTREEVPDHGTSVAGLIAAEGWNGLGGRGVSPNAKLIGMNYLGGNNTQTDRNEMIVHGMPGSGIVESDNVVSFNRSYGYPLPVVIMDGEIGEAMTRYPTEVLRNGKGALNIKSNGNFFVGSVDYPTAAALCQLQQAGIQEGVPIVLGCLDGNWDGSNASFYTISIGAVNSDGAHTSYSSSGANLWVSAPAGESGTFEPAMVTTDETTCFRGYSSWTYIDPFVATEGTYFASLGLDASEFYTALFPFDIPGGDSNRQHNASCNYTSTFNGTSSAAPNTSGVANLIASANPELTWREIRHILAVTATTVSPDDAPITLTLPDGEFVAHAGWVENAAGYSFNNLFGYGRPDAGAAVALAKEGVELPELKETEWRTWREEVEGEALPPGLDIPDNSASGVEVEIEVTDELSIEGVQFAFSISNPDMTEALYENIIGTTAASDIAIEVTSPAGTRSVIATSRTSLGVLGVPIVDRDTRLIPETDQLYTLDAPILTNAFYGESAVGTWKIKILDTNGNDYDGFSLNNRQPSRVNQAKVRIFGH